MTPALHVVAGPDGGRVFPLTGPAAVGRAAGNPVHLSDPTVSRVHCELVPTPAGWRVLDRGSGNGTRVNGAAVSGADLRPGDRIAVGDSVLEFRADPRPVVRDGPSAVVRTLAADAGSRILQGGDSVRTRLAALGVLYAATAAVAQPGDVAGLLGRVLDLLLPAADADHGCVLVDEAGGLVPAAARGRDGSPEVVVSRTVAEHVHRTGEGLLVRDAPADERFAGGASVLRPGLRHLVCVPLAGRRGGEGVLFLGGRRAFTPDHLALAAAVGHLAALAVEEARAVAARVRAERLAAVGETMAHTGHHIKNVMQGVRTGGDLVRIGLADGDLGLVQKGWGLVERNQARIDALMLDLLGLAKEREPGRAPTDLPALAADAVDAVRGRAGDSGVSLTLEAGDLPPVPCDPDGVYRAVLNLLSNALDAAEGTPDAAVRMVVGVRGGVAEVVVQDTGPGVPVERTEAIFEPFSSDKGGRGTGLGLPAARKTAREHGGDVRCGPGPGGRFVLTLPLDPPA